MHSLPTDSTTPPITALRAWVVEWSDDLVAWLLEESGDPDVTGRASRLSMSMPWAVSPGKDLRLTPFLAYGFA